MAAYLLRDPKGSGECGAAINRFLDELLCPVNPYISQFTRPVRTLSDGIYRQEQELSAMVAALAKFYRIDFPSNLLDGLTDQLEIRPEGAKGCLVVASYHELGRHFGVADVYGDGMPMLVARTAELLAKRITFGNYLTLKSGTIQTNPDVRPILEREDGKGRLNAYWLPDLTQWGGRSPLNSRWECLQAGQLAMPTLYGLQGVVQMPQWITGEQMRPDLIGDDYWYGGAWSHCPGLGRGGDEGGLGAGWRGGPGGGAGGASLLPRSAA
ncbi:MAG: hypothetical protein V1826_02580 [bacterium]